jgi:rubredoxin
MTAEIIHVCIVCNHLHDKEKEGEWENLPKDFKCPVCGCNKDEYRDELWHSV